MIRLTSTWALRRRTAWLSRSPILILLGRDLECNLFHADKRGPSTTNQKIDLPGVKSHQLSTANGEKYDFDWMKSIHITCQQGRSPKYPFAVTHTQHPISKLQYHSGGQALPIVTGPKTYCFPEQTQSSLQQRVHCFAVDDFIVSKEESQSPKDGKTWQDHRGTSSCWATGIQPYKPNFVLLQWRRLALYLKQIAYKNMRQQSLIAMLHASACMLFYLMVLPVRNRTHCGTGRFWFIFLASTRLILNVLCEAWNNNIIIHEFSLKKTSSWPGIHPTRKQLSRAHHDESCSWNRHGERTRMRQSDEDGRSLAYKVHCGNRLPWHLAFRETERVSSR